MKTSLRCSSERIHDEPQTSQIGGNLLRGSSLTIIRIHEPFSGCDVEKRLLGARIGRISAGLLYVSDAFDLDAVWSCFNLLRSI